MSSDMLESSGKSISAIGGGLLFLAGTGFTVLINAKKVHDDLPDASILCAVAGGTLSAIGSILLAASRVLNLLQKTN